MAIAAALSFLLAYPAQAAAPATLEALLSRESALMREAAKKPKDEKTAKSVAEVRAKIASRKFSAGDVPGAVAYLENSVRLDGSRPERWIMLGDLYQVLGIPSSAYLAQDAYEAALKLKPGDRPLLARLGASYLAKGRYERAIERLEAAVEGGEKDKPELAYLQALGAAYAAAEDSVRGAKFFDRMTKKGGDVRFKLASAILEWNSPGAWGPIGALKRRSALKRLQEVEQEAKGTPLGVYVVRLRHTWENEKEESK